MRESAFAAAISSPRICSRFCDVKTKLSFKSVERQ
jgi:hypothetical protein